MRPYFTQKQFLTAIKYPEGNPGYRLFVFINSHHQEFISAQPVKVRFVFRPAVPAATNLIGYALLLKNKLLLLSSDGQRQFDLV